MASTNQCIGSHYDELKHRVFFFNYNSAGYSGIYVYDVKLNTITPLLISFVDSAEDLFGFDPKYPIASVNILYRTEADGDILHWTDRLNRPMKLNIKDALDKLYGTAWKKEYLTVARKMPLVAPISTYQNAIAPNGTPINVNNLKNKLFQFSYRWVYNDNTKSCWSPWGKMSAPYSTDDLAIESDPTKNNAIDSIIETGPADAVKIEISVREAVSSVFSDRAIVTTLTKSTLGIANESTYTFRFLNDGAYPLADSTDSVQLFDYVPKKANAQELLNGNVIVYGGITEGNTPVSTTDIIASVASVVAGGAGNEIPMTISAFASGRKYSYVFYGTPVVGDYVKVVLTITPDSGPVTYRYYDHTVVTGDTLASIIDDLQAQAIADGYTAIDITSGGNPGVTFGSTVGTDVVTGVYQIIYASSTIPTEINSAVYKHSSKYQFGIAYFDEYGVTNGVITNEGLKILMPEAQCTNVGNKPLSVPEVTIKINHTPPTWAKYYSFVRTNNTTVGEFKMMTTLNTYKDTNYGYLNITPYNTNTAGYPIYSFSKGDRVRIYGLRNSAIVTVKDYAILDMLPTLLNTTGSYLKLAYDSTFMSGWESAGAVVANEYFIEVYTPAVGSTDPNLQVFYEFGETYKIITDINGQRVHQGQLLSQVSGTNSSILVPSALTATLLVEAGNINLGKYKYRVEFVTPSGVSTPSNESNTITTVTGSTKIALSNIAIGPTGTTQRKIYRTTANGSQYKLLATINDNTTTTYTDNTADNQLGVTMPTPAMFVFSRGDVYSRNRGGLYIFDKSVSDKYASKISNTGRALVIDDYAKETYYPSTVRYSLEYQQNTSINNTNKFLSGNLDDYDRERGDIQRFKTRGRELRIFQSRACGVAPILQNMLQTADGNTVVAQSTEILNKIQYYKGDYGIGGQYCSLASSARADYFTDPVLGCQIRLSDGGMTSLTETYKTHFFFTDKISKYQKTTYADKFGDGGYAKILGVYDAFEEEFITCMQGSGSELTDYTFGFSEARNAYSAFYDYYPEWIETAGNLIISWKDGELWVHNNTSAYANFYGEQKIPSLKVVFNDSQNIKKHYNTLTTLGNTTWIAPTAGDINTNMNQQSQLVASDFRIKDDKYHAAFKRDINSVGGLYNGNVLKGSWIEIKFTPVNPQNLVDLYYMELGILQPYNNR